jgi:propionyl-CoA carboxylase alpha chain
VRCDSGIEEGSEISIYYDPMICKLITYAKSRDQAIEKQIQALDEYVIRGVTHNIPLLRDIFTEKLYRSGNITTAYLPTVYPDGFSGKVYTQEEKNDLVAIAAAFHARDAYRSGHFLNAAEPTIASPNELELAVYVGGEHYVAHVKREAKSFDVRNIVFTVGVKQAIHYHRLQMRMCNKKVDGCQGAVGVLMEAITA